MVDDAAGLVHWKWKFGYCTVDDACRAVAEAIDCVVIAAVVVAVWAPSAAVVAVWAPAALLEAEK